ncbi:hypothetical protein BJ165DRAFT_1410701 [Panaeolus papilionaceus]|nr:hypothetical protein BJ165DRAFT_1410701 [Panaeolus papilionaceus]
MEASADPRITTNPAIPPTDTVLYSELRACTDSSTAYSALQYHPIPGLNVHDPSQLYDEQWPQDGYIQQQYNEPNAFISSFNPVSDMASFSPQETHSSMHDEFLVWQDAPPPVGPCYSAMEYRDSAVSNIAPSSEPHGYTTLPTTINSPPNALTPGLEFFDINGPCDEHLFHAESISEHHTPSFNPQEPHPTYGEFPARQDASPLTGPCCPPVEYHSPPPTTFANPDLVSPGRQITASLATQSMHHWHPEPIHDGTISQMLAHDVEYERDLRRSKDPRCLEVLEITIGTMAQVKVPNDGLVLPETRERINQGIENLVQSLKGELSLSSTDAELQYWIQRVLDQFPKRDPVGTSAKIDKALERRQYKRDSLYICFWCESTLTTANGLGSEYTITFNAPLILTDVRTIE